PKTNLAQYDIQIAAILFIFLFVAKRFLIHKDTPSRLMESVIFTMIILGTVNTTGGTGSPFFFLIYFLLFSISLLLEPVISISATLSLVIFFLFSLPENQNLKSLLPIFSLAFLTPFAMFMGQQYGQNEKLKVKSQKLEEDALLFLSLMLKNHIKNIKDAVENFMGDKELHEIKKTAQKMEKIIEEYEKNT
ncbi:hypothetical protein HY041_02265, partial [Candidatus Roizmanbacteria bacterium]|nr:hypothetical protein [Candidatus Roizmanbacteria bacterium]